MQACLQRASDMIQNGMELLGQNDYDIPASGLDWHGDVGAEIAKGLTPGPNVIGCLGLLSTATLAARMWQ